MLNPAQTLILIPVYNGAPILRDTLQTLKSITPSLNLLVVDDGSTDASADIAEALAVEVLRQSPNQGKGTALYAGIYLAWQRNYQWVISLDADGQHAPADLNHFFNTEITEKTGVLAGQRHFKLGLMPWARVFSNTVTTWIVSALVGSKVYDSQCGYRAYRTKMLEQGVFPLFGRFEWESSVLVKAIQHNWQILPVPVQTLYFEGRGSHISHLRDTLRFLKLVGLILKSRVKK
jgi:glycosyltransferase involved in cell wall biosynthesis